jgi:hypothetical protein
MGEYLDAIIQNYEELEGMKNRVNDLNTIIKSLEKENETLKNTIVSLWTEITQLRRV